MSHTVFGSSRIRSKIGSQGPRGIPGVKGEKGDKGDKGVMGDKGDKGDTGLNGSNGIKGNIGEKGERGEKGNRGEKGEKGEIGARGDKGERGEIGKAGDRGLRGEKGEVGPPGISISDIAVTQNSKSFSLIFNRTDGTSINVGPIDISADNEIIQAPASVIDLEVIPGRYQYSIKLTKSDGTMKLYDILLSDPSEAANRRRKPP